MAATRRDHVAYGRQRQLLVRILDRAPCEWRCLRSDISGRILERNCGGRQVAGRKGRFLDEEISERRRISA
jgi:hypothetical protein